MLLAMENTKNPKQYIRAKKADNLSVGPLRTLLASQ